MVAIDLDANKVNEKIFCTDKEHIFPALHMNKMMYDEAELIESAAMCIKNFYKISKSDFIFQPPAIVLGALYNGVIACKKDSSFCGENEIRIDYRQKIHDYFEWKHSKLKNPDIDQTYFAPIRGEIRSLHHLNLSEIWDSDLIPEIMLGPNCPQSVEELRAFLDANGLQNTKITESKIPLR